MGGKQKVFFPYWHFKEGVEKMGMTEHPLMRGICFVTNVSSASLEI